MPVLDLRKMLGIFPLLVIIVISVTTNVFDLHAVFRLPQVAAGGYFFIALVLFLTTYISAKSYLGSGSPTILLLSSGALTYGLTSLITGLLLIFMGAGNASATIFLTGILFASILNLQGIILLSLGVSSELELKRRKIILAANYLFVPILMVLLTLATLQGVTPTFAAPANTLLGSWVIVINATIFTVCSVTFMWRYFKLRTDLLYWYSLGLGLVAIGSFAVLTLTTPDDLHHWAARSAYYLSGVYFIVANLTTS